MTTHSTRMMTLAALAMVSAPALAASDYLLTIPSGKGDAASAPIEVASWSFGVCNAGCMANQGAARGPRQSTSRSGVATGAGAAAGAAAIGDLDGDGMPDLAYSATQDTIYGLSFTVDATGPVVSATCASGRIDTATLSNGADTFAISGVSVVCTKGLGGGASTAAYARSGINRIDSTPARISTNLTVGKQTQTQSFGERSSSPAPRCADGTCAAAGMMTMTLTGGQMKHTKTGHVTLLK